RGEERPGHIRRALRVELAEDRGGLPPGQLREDRLDFPDLEPLQHPGGIRRFHGAEDRGQAPGALRRAGRGRGDVAFLDRARRPPAPPAPAVSGALPASGAGRSSATIATASDPSVGRRSCAPLPVSRSASSWPGPTGPRGNCGSPMPGSASGVSPAPAASTTSTPARGAANSPATVPPLRPRTKPARTKSSSLITATPPPCGRFLAWPCRAGRSRSHPGSAARPAADRAASFRNPAPGAGPGSAAPGVRGSWPPARRSRSLPPLPSPSSPPRPGPPGDRARTGGSGAGRPTRPGRAPGRAGPGPRSAPPPAPASPAAPSPPPCAPAPASPPFPSPLAGAARAPSPVGSCTRSRLTPALDRSGTGRELEHALPRPLQVRRLVRPLTQEIGDGVPQPDRGIDHRVGPVLVGAHGDQVPVLPVHGQELEHVVRGAAMLGIDDLVPHAARAL